jgi:hypothetical protein
VRLDAYDKLDCHAMSCHVMLILDADTDAKSNLIQSNVFVFSFLCNCILLADDHLDLRLSIYNDVTILDT